MEFIKLIAPADVDPISDINPGAVNKLYLKASLFDSKEIDSV